MNILIVEDERIVADVLKKILNKIEFVNIVQIAVTFDEAYRQAMSQIFDVILVDIFLDKDDLTGLDLCKSIRQENQEVVLIMLTAMHSLQYLEKAFRFGVNDYITKPFHHKEVELRVKRWLMLVHKIMTHSCICYKELSYDTVKNNFYFQGELLKLTKKQKQLLLIFIKNAEQIVDKNYLQEKVWGDLDIDLKKRNVRSLMQLLRNALPSDLQGWLKTVRGEGYILESLS